MKPQETTADRKRRVLRALWRAKMHADPRALNLVPASVRERYAHVWEPAQLLMAELEALPLGLLQLWEAGQCGHLVFTHADSCYQPGHQTWLDALLESVCFLSLVDLAGPIERAMVPFFHLLDHLLGSGARDQQPWLSSGAGLTADLREVARRFQQIHALAYGHTELAVTTAEDYFAQTLWLYLRDARRLNVLDPLLYRLYRHTLLNEAFWQVG